MNEMYNRIEGLCKQKGVNVTQMCKEAGIPRGNLSDLKHGRTAALSTKTLGKISEYFGVPIESLIGTEEVNPSTFAANLSRHMGPFEDAGKISQGTGIPVKVVEDLIAGNRSPKSADIEKIAKYLFVEREDLTDTWTEKLDGLGNYTIEDVDFDTYDIVGKYGNLTPAQKRATRQVIETFLWGAPGKWKY